MQDNGHWVVSKDSTTNRNSEHEGVWVWYIYHEREEGEELEWRAGIGWRYIIENMGHEHIRKC